MPRSQDETSEEFIGEWVEKRGIRDQVVIATKVCAIQMYGLLRVLMATSTVHYELQAWERQHSTKGQLHR